VDAQSNPALNVLSFGEGIAAGDLSLGLGSLAIRVGNNSNDAIHIANFNPNDVFGQRAIDRFAFAPSPGSGQAGTVLTYAELLARGFELAGTAGNDTPRQRSRTATRHTAKKPNAYYFRQIARMKRAA
jgi:hypothetical protein